MRWPTRVSGHWPVRPTVSVCSKAQESSCEGGVKPNHAAERKHVAAVAAVMPVEEFIVTNVQWLLPTWFLRLLVRLYLRYSGGPAMRGGDVVIKQIHVDSLVKSSRPEASAICPPARPASARTRRGRPSASAGRGQLAGVLAGRTYRPSLPHRWTRSSGVRSP